MKILSDNAIATKDDDAYGFVHYAELLTDIILETGSLPFTIGIFSDWGTGKSSLMHLIDICLNESSPYIKTVWFNPWKYEGRDEILHACIQSVLISLKNASVEKDIKKLTGAAAWFFLKKSVGIFSSGIINESSLDKVMQFIQKQDEEYYRHFNKFEKDFDKLVKTCIGKDSRLILFIDDLDRCLPENAIKIMEALKLFLGSEKCVFVFGMDQKVIEMGISKKYGDQIEFDGRSYLSKLIQVPFHIPSIKFNNIKAGIIKKCDIAGQLPKTVWDIANFGMGGNPRNIKRFINSLLIIAKIIQSDHILSILSEKESEKLSSIPDNKKMCITGKLLVFQIVYADFFRILKYRPYLWMKIDEIIHQNSDCDKSCLSGLGHDIKGLDDDTFFEFMKETTWNVKGDFYPSPEEDVLKILIKIMSILSTKD